MSTANPTEAFLRINLTEGLDENDLENLAASARQLGSLDKALIRAIRAGLPKVTKASRSSRKGDKSKKSAR